MTTEIKLGGAWAAHHNQAITMQNEIVSLKGKLLSSRWTITKYKGLQYQSTNGMLKIRLNIERKDEIIKKLERELRKEKETNRLLSMKGDKSKLQFCAALTSSHFQTKKIDGLLNQLENTLDINDRLNERLKESEEEVCALQDLYNQLEESGELSRDDALELSKKLKIMTKAKASQDKHLVLLVKEKDRLYDQLLESNSSKKMKQQTPILTSRASKSSNITPRSNSLLKSAALSTVYQTPFKTPGTKTTRNQSTLKSKGNVSSSSSTPTSCSTINSIHFDDTPSSVRSKFSAFASASSSRRRSTSKIGQCYVKELTRALQKAHQEIQGRDAVIDNLEDEKKELLTRFRNASAVRSTTSRSKKTSSPNDTLNSIMTDLTNRYSQYANSMKRE